MSTPTVAVQCAIPEESAKIVESLQDATTETIHHNVVTTGMYAGKHVVVVMGGMGMANSAAAAQFIIDRYDPQALIFSGIAGSINPGLDIADVVVAREQHYAESNMEVIADCEPFLKFFPSDPALVADAERAAQELGLNRVASQAELREQGSAMAGTLALDAHVSADHQPSYVVGNLSTSDRFNTDPDVLRELIARFDAEGEAMEEASAGQVCARCDVPFLCIRGISNPCGDSYSDLNTQQRSMQRAADAAADVTLGTLRQMAERL